MSPSKYVPCAIQTESPDQLEDRQINKIGRPNDKKIHKLIPTHY